VWFTGIGWVPFDPTPARSPAQSQVSPLGTSAAAADAGEVRRQGVGAAERVTDTGGTLDSGGSGWLPRLLLVLAAVALVAGGLLVGRRVHRLRGLRPDEVVESQLSELRRALVDLGWDLPASTTLLALERRLGRFAGPVAERYAAALRANRYDPRSPSGPSLADRRALRRELTRGSVFDRFRGFVAIPPGGPRP
jgi:hypothetical protein